MKKSKKIKMDKKGQEEIVGFALIIILVAIVFLIFLGFSLKNSEKEATESYEVQSFIQSSLKYTSDCKNHFGHHNVQDLIFECNSGVECTDGRDTCEVLNSTINQIADESWDVGENTPTKGYKLEIITGDSLMVNITKGNETRNLKGSFQEFSKGGELFQIYFTVYE